ncbi:MAG: O-acetyl-ADP-ribose deacetylase [SAR202 cluster bacterium Io17-Chloro-G9]|nr:MAG: O-acetyl-ADP-ribose deacetylase [SAR202 cluster bacterium Io17-Chloro-G9]
MIDRISLIREDITKLQVDAIVNAANNSLLGGGGVDGAIHRAAGPQLLEECRSLGGCSTGEAKVTRGYNLSAKWVIHTVGPVWQGGGHGEDELLAQCYRCSLALGGQYDVKTIAFPAISAGVYGFPMERAAGIAVTVVHAYLQQDNKLESVTLVCFNDRAVEAFTAAIQDICRHSPASA